MKVEFEKKKGHKKNFSKREEKKEIRIRGRQTNRQTLLDTHIQREKKGL